MEQVMWFFADESGKVLEQTLKGINEEEQAIDELSLRVQHEKYILGYFRSDGSKKIYQNARQIV